MTDAALAVAPERDDNIMRVLIIDDDDVDRERCSRLLGKSPGPSLETVAVSSVSEAEYWLRRQRFDCILVDYYLQDRTGLDFAAHHHQDTDPPVILLTGNGSETIALKALRTGVSDYLIKSCLTGHALRRALANAAEKAALRASVRAHVRAVEMANLTLQWRNNEIQQFYHSVSHELKTPLTAAREFISLVADGTAGFINDEQREFLVHALDCCDQMVVHFNDLVEATRLETGKLKLVRRAERIDPIVLRARMAVTALAEARGVGLVDNVAPDLPEVMVDAGRILQVMANLLTNAVKYTDAGGIVTIGAESVDGGRVRISVSDTGCGIETQHLPHIFERLYQVGHADGEHAADEGLGLGLWIAKEIVDLHGGSLDVESEPRRGSTFSFTVPAATGPRPHGRETTQ